MHNMSNMSNYAKYVADRLVSKEPTQENTRLTTNIVAIHNVCRVFCLCIPIRQKMSETIMHQSVTSCGITFISLAWPFAEFIVVNRNPTHWNPILWFRTFFFRQIEKRHWKKVIQISYTVICTICNICQIYNICNIC